MHYVISDIHGNERRFRSVMNQIHLQPEDTLYVLGDVVDRYPGAIRILREIMAMPNARMLLGNHEYMMLRALGVPYDDYADDGGAWDHWYRNGGQETYESFKDLSEEEKQEIVTYLRGLPLSFDVPVNGRHYKLVHGAPPECYDPEGLKHKSPAYYAVWRRLDAADTFSGEYTLVFGHTPTRYYQQRVPMELWYGPGTIGIDCGSGYPEDGEKGKLGRLACLRLEDRKVFYSEEKK